ncbi:GNAT family N-acetyltransferase [Cohnella sp. JJ-181]|uniref:GNAT family N-acetyltransferase n=1 Tax=Cohnella rhizoplanae TaxID=2974897 RepID=UPI0022FF63AC|nr:GNAT family N-acetyltransferase [Cohnella sp. JJ-181]CAI6086817.1 Acetyltransferase YpeA [Cohnella sp. JJ-181]
MKMEFRKMEIADYDRMIALWRRIDGLALSEADEREAIAVYLRRNEGLSFVCEADGALAGTILCGHDGRRGFIYHAAVDADYRGRGIARQLAELSLAKLRDAGIDKCHLFVLEDNGAGDRFWTATGWRRRSGFFVYSRDV